MADQAREGLSALSGVTVRDQGKVRGGIVTFTKQGLAPGRIKESLREARINVWTNTVRSARLDMEARNLEEVVRASFHYFNTEQEVEALVSEVKQMRA